LAGAGSFGPYCERRVPASCEDNPFDASDGSSTCLVGSVDNALSSRTKKCYITSTGRTNEIALVTADTLVALSPRSFLPFSSSLEPHHVVDRSKRHKSSWTRVFHRLGRLDALFYPALAHPF
jgi:hypothetical protein